MQIKRLEGAERGGCRMHTATRARKRQASTVEGEKMAQTLSALRAAARWPDGPLASKITARQLERWRVIGGDAILFVCCHGYRTVRTRRRKGCGRRMDTESTLEENGGQSDDRSAG